MPTCSEAHVHKVIEHNGHLAVAEGVQHYFSLQMLISGVIRAKDTSTPNSTFSLYPGTGSRVLPVSSFLSTCKAPEEDESAAWPALDIRVTITAVYQGQPNFLNEVFPAQLVAAHTPLSHQLLLHHHLCGDASVITARVPQVIPIRGKTTAQDTGVSSLSAKLSHCHTWLRCFASTPALLPRSARYQDTALAPLRTASPSPAPSTRVGPERAFRDAGGSSVRVCGREELNSAATRARRLRKSSGRPPKNLVTHQVLSNASPHIPTVSPARVPMPVTPVWQLFHRAPSMEQEQ
ncbi:hypothetical protein EYF80_008118 [Liparis tanakae]|uniref:Uncharacterized protein n=1 Tax=Liparis tanakae TaxID=230148 RepID=A0A4Z2IWK7_9TELE|nr:hypothetical protein EYF80_008118 [Liparis tanakae]